MTTSRTKRKYALSPGATRRQASEFNDCDYASRLTDPADIAFLRDFYAEYYQMVFAPEGPNIHDDPESRRPLYRTDNARRRDLWNNLNRINLSPEALDGKSDDSED